MANIKTAAEKAAAIAGAVEAIHQVIKLIEPYIHHFIFYLSISQRDLYETELVRVSQEISLATDIVDARRQYAVLLNRYAQLLMLCAENLDSEPDSGSPEDEESRPASDIDNLDLRRRLRERQEIGIELNPGNEDGKQG